MNGQTQTSICDACLEGLGAINSDQYFHAVFPSFIQDLHLHINSLELLTIVVSLKMWGKKFYGEKDCCLL